MSEFPGKYTASTTLDIQQSFVDGEYLPSTSGKSFPVRHPGNDEVICHIETAGYDEVDAAVTGLTSLLEPVMMVVLGGSIGSLLIAMYLPIFKIAEAIK